MITTDWAMIGAVAQVFAVIVSIIGFFFLTWQVRISSKVARADFVMRLESEYVSHHLAVYQKFLSRYNDNLHCVVASRLLENEVDVSEIEHYLAFFETIEVLLSEKLINIKIIDKTFAYRFFIVVNNPYVRELIEQDKAYWELLFILYHDWAKWRKIHGKPIPNSEFPLVDSVE